MNELWGLTALEMVLRAEKLNAAKMILSSHDKDGNATFAVVALYGSETQKWLDRLENDTWLNVEEELPKKDGNYWAFVIDGLGVDFQREVQFRDGRFILGKPGFFVTHYRALFEPPKEYSDEVS